jgi:predicted NAD/FAD-dependent oxidoreductase
MAKIIIAGAGLSGLVAARELQNGGHEVLVLEKSAQAGGRMATQKIGGATFDSGAQFFTARSEEFKNALAHWLENGVAREWFAGYPSRENKKSSDTYPRYCGARGMRSIAEFLARDVEIHFQTAIETLDFRNQIWTARAASGREYSGDFLILTAPIPQSLALFDSSARVLPARVRAALEGVEYAPCLAVLANLKNAPKLSAPGALSVDGEPIAWLADNFQKGVSPRAGALTIHSTGKFACENYEADENLIAEKLLAAAQKIFDAPLDIENFQVRRWRFSKPQNALEEGAVCVSDLNLCLAGDGLYGAKIEGAWGSGLAAARKISKRELAFAKRVVIAREP